MGGYVSADRVKSQINVFNTSLFNCAAAAKYFAIAIPFFILFRALRDKDKWKDYPLAMPKGSVRALLAFSLVVLEESAGAMIEDFGAPENKRS